MRIGAIQLAIMATSQTESQFVRRLVRHLQRSHTEVTIRFHGQSLALDAIPMNTLQRLVQFSIARARGHGLTWERSLASFVALMFTIAPNFDEQPEIMRILGDKTASPDEQFERLKVEVSDAAWAAAEAAYDNSAWEIS